jgi:hypothetical protein
MNRPVKDALLFFFCGLVLIAGLSFFSCGDKSNPVTPSKNPSLTDFEIALSGWHTPGDSIRWIGSDSMFGYVDGGDWSYIQDSTGPTGHRVSTLDTGMHQVFFQTADSLNYAESFVLDYGTAANALITYNRFKGKISIAQQNKLNIGVLDTIVAIGGMSLGSDELIAYAHFDKYFLEFRIFRDFNNPVLTNDSLVAISNTFVTKCQSLIQ